MSSASPLLLHMGPLTFAVLTPHQTHLRLYQTLTGLPTTQLQLPLAPRPTSVAVLDQAQKAPSRPRKRARSIASSAPSADSTTVLAIGHADGSIVLLDANHAAAHPDPPTPRLTLSPGATPSPVTAVVLDPANRVVWGSYANGAVRAYDLLSGDLQAHLPQSRVTPADDAVVVAVASDGRKLTRAVHGRIELYSVQRSTALDETVLSINYVRRFTGHAGPVRDMAFTQDARFLMSAARQDRYLALWDCEVPTHSLTPTKKPYPPTALFLADAAPLGVVMPSTASTTSTDATVTFATVADDGALYAWPAHHLRTLSSTRPSVPHQKPIPPCLRLHPAAKDKDPIAIYAAAFTDFHTLACATAPTGSGTVTVVSKELPAVPSQTNECIDVELPLSRTLRGHPQVSEDALVGRRNGDGRGAAPRSEIAANPRVVGAADLPAVDGRSEGEKPTEKEDPETGLGSAKGDKTMREKLEALGVEVPGSRRTAEEQKAGVDSVATVLSQAVRTHDTALLETALHAVTKRTAVERTVNGLSADVVPSLLEALVERFESRPRRASGLVVWLRAVVAQHVGVVVSAPQGTAALRRLRACVEDRLHPFNKLLALQGRLDILVERMKVVDDEVPEVMNIPATEYVEGNEEDDADRADERVEMSELNATAGDEDQEEAD